MIKKVMDMFHRHYTACPAGAIQKAVDRNAEAKRLLLHKSSRAEETFDSLALALIERRKRRD